MAQISGTAEADMLFGGNAIDFIDGDAGDDTIYGGLRYDAINGGEGHDFLVGDILISLLPTARDSQHTEMDWIRGGSGNDTIVGGLFSTATFEPAMGQPVESFLAVKNGMTSGNAGDALWGQAGDDKIYGTNGDDVAGGGTGDDFMRMLGGDDTLFGGPGNDAISKSSGSGVFFGGEGDDVITASFESDTIWGGAGDDTLDTGGAIGDHSDYLAFLTGHGNDVVLTFTPDKDTLDFSGIDGAFATIVDVEAASENVVSPNSQYDFAMLIRTSETDSVLLLSNSEIVIIDLNILL